MQIAASSGTGVGLASRNGAPEDPQSVAEAPRVSLPAVIQPVIRREAERPPLSGRPSVVLLAQLLANAENLPCARNRRRQEPPIACETYRAMTNPSPSFSPREVAVI
jgi:hypothetical protein